MEGATLVSSVRGYLLVYSESVKPDTGGAFWYAQMNHVQQGLFIYVLRHGGSAFLGAIDSCQANDWRPLRQI